MYHINTTSEKRGFMGDLEGMIYYAYEHDDRAIC